MIAKRNEFVKKTAGQQERGDRGIRWQKDRATRGYGNPYFKKGLEKLRRAGVNGERRREF